MRISDNEVQRILSSQQSIVCQILEIEEGIDDSPPAIDPDLVKEVARRVMALPDREEMIAELKARIQAGAYSPTGDEIAEAMIRRAIADRVR